ncbi:MAG: hypothetical protein KC478_03885 [Bacteriovoracaceae bacterium]|nr:hypothetical protein [Bacteriovoracaceae bacterium]
MNILIRLLIFSFFWVNAYAGPVDITFATFYSSKRVYRGALIWDQPVMGFGPSFTFYDKFSIGKGGISYFKKLDDHLTFKVGYNYFDDSEPGGGPILKLGGSSEDFKNNRKPTSDIYIDLSYRKRRGLSSTFTMSKDITRHHGIYAYSSASMGIAPFVSAGLGVGIANESHNQYVYGPEGVGGIGHIDGFIAAMLPFLPYKGRLLLKWSRIEITQSENVQAEYIQGNHLNHSLSMVALWKIL